MKGEARYDARVRLNGKPVTKTFVRRGDADAWLRQVLADDLAGVAIDPKAGRVDFSTYAATFLARGGTRGNLAPKTASYYGDLLRLHIKPTFGEHRVSAIKPGMVKDWYSSLSADRPKLAPKAYRLLSTIMGAAVSDRLIGSNPCQIRGAGVERASERPLLTPADAQDLADFIARPFRAMVLLAEFCQLRLGELLGLMVDDLDLAGRTVRVERQALELRGDGRVIAQPKTDAGKRTVSLPAGLVPELVDHIEAYCPPTVADRWLFATATGRPWWRWEWHVAWSEAKAAVDASRTEAGLPLLPEGLHMHDLRHSGLTLVAMTGVTTKELMRRGGHASPTAALRYQHVAEGRDREIGDRLGEMFDFARVSRDQRAMAVTPISAARSARDGKRKAGEARGRKPALTR